jgi:rhomboid family protein
LPLKDNVPSLRAPLATLTLIGASIVLWAVDWSPDLSDTWWPAAALASLFVGGGFIELVVDMLFLWLFGKTLEDTLGRPRFVALFALGGLAAAAGQAVADPDAVAPSVGVAGSVAALIGAYALLYPRAALLCWVLIPFFVTFVEVPALALAVVWFALQPLLGAPPLMGLAAGLVFGLLAARPFAHGRTLIADRSQPGY